MVRVKAAKARNEAKATLTRAVAPCRLLNSELRAAGHHRTPVLVAKDAAVLMRDHEVAALRVARVPGLLGRSSV